jgi:TPR repeat protein
MSRIAKRLIFSIMALLLACSPCASAGEEGLRAYRAGNRQKAFQLWMQDAQKGDTDAQYHIALCYRDGDAVAKDPQEALRWLKMSAERGFGSSQMELGRFYAVGLAGAVDGNEARKWYEKAIANGNVRARNLLGILYLNGVGGIPQDYGRAYDLFKEASGKLGAAAFNVGLMHEKGLGRKVDLVEACAWYSLAFKKEEPAAKEKRDGIIRRLSPQETAQMDARVSELDPSHFWSSMAGNWEEYLSFLVIVVTALQLFYLIGSLIAGRIAARKAAAQRTRA